MNKAKELKTLTGLVFLIMLKESEARNSDNYLYKRVIEYQATHKNIDIRNMQLLYFLSNLSDLGFAPFESVRRTRQKLQARFPFLAASEEVQEFRAENEEVYREFAKE